MVAILIFGLGAGVSIIEGIDKIRHPHEVYSPIVAYVVLEFSFVFEGATWIVAFRAFRAHVRRDGLLEAVQRSKDPTVFTVLLEDSAALAGICVAAVGLAVAQYLRWPALDGVASVVIGCLLAATAAFLAYECKGLLMGEAADRSVQDSLRNIATSSPGVTGVNEVLTMHFGPVDVLAVLSIDFDDELSAAVVEDTVSRIERVIKQTHPQIRRIFVEAQSRGGHLNALEDIMPRDSA